MVINGNALITVLSKVSEVNQNMVYEFNFNTFN